MIAAVLLAAGESSRMGAPKQLLDWGGKPLVRAQIDELLAAGCQPVVVVVGAHAQQVRAELPSSPTLQIATNRAWREGRASSIRAGTRCVPDASDAVLIASVDQPTTAAIVSQLAAALADAPDARIAVPQHDGRNGHPPIFSTELLPMLRAVTERTEGLRAVRRQHRERTIFVEMPDPFVTLNLNTPDAYRRALTLL